MKARISKKRGYLLPKGCNDLIDVLKPKPKRGPEPVVRTIMLPPIVGELTLPAVMTVGGLANGLTQKPSRIIADIVKLFGSVVTAHNFVQLHEVSQEVRLY